MWQSLLVLLTVRVVLVAKVYLVLPYSCTLRERFALTDPADEPQAETRRT